MLFDKGKITFYCRKHNVLTWFVMFYVWFHIKRRFDYLLLNHKSNPFLRTEVVHFVIRLHFIPFCHSFWKSCNLFFSHSMLCIDQVSGKVLRKKIIIVSVWFLFWSIVLYSCFKYSSALQNVLGIFLQIYTFDPTKYVTSVCVIPFRWMIVKADTYIYVVQIGCRISCSNEYIRIYQLMPLSLSELMVFC